jgi:hypothetical protein
MTARKAPAMRSTDASVAGFLASVPDERRRADARRLCTMMQEVTGEPPVMWGTSIIGFGAYHYRYASGHEGDSALAAFSPRSQHLAIYLVGGFETRHQSVLARLGPHKTGKGPGRRGGARPTARRRRSAPARRCGREIFDVDLYPGAVGRSRFTGMPRSSRIAMVWSPSAASVARWHALLSGWLPGP